MDCYFHQNVPSVAPCADCAKPICATCRDNAGTCPSCRLAAKMEAASAARPGLAGEVPPRAKQAWRQPWQEQQPGPARRPAARVATADTADSAESRALVALGYPLWPLALISLFDRTHSKRLRKQAYQALGFNLGMAALWGLLTVVVSIPVLKIGAALVLAFWLPVLIVLSIYYGIKVWHGEDARVPILSDWLDERLPA